MSEMYMLVSEPVYGNSRLLGLYSSIDKATDAAAQYIEYDPIKERLTIYSITADAKPSYYCKDAVWMQHPNGKQEWIDRDQP